MLNKGALLGGVSVHHSVDGWQELLPKNMWIFSPLFLKPDDPRFDPDIDVTSSVRGWFGSSEYDDPEREYCPPEPLKYYEYEDGRRPYSVVNWYGKCSHYIFSERKDNEFDDFFYHELYLDNHFYCIILGYDMVKMPIVMTPYAIGREMRESPQTIYTATEENNEAFFFPYEKNKKGYGFGFMDEKGKTYIKNLFNIPIPEAEHSLKRPLLCIIKAELLGNDPMTEFKKLIPLMPFSKKEIRIFLSTNEFGVIE